MPTDSNLTLYQVTCVLAKERDARRAEPPKTCGIRRFQLRDPLVRLRSLLFTANGLQIDTA